MYWCDIPNHVNKYNYILAHCTFINSVAFIHCFSLLISFALPMKSSVQGISSPPCGRSLEYCHVPETVHCIDPPLRRKREQILEIFLGRCPMIVLSFITATA